MRSASEKYPSISKNRPLNSPCGKTDSASVKREAQQIKSRDYHADDWAMILSYSLGLEIDSPDFERDMKEMQDIVAGPGNSSYRHTNCQIQKNMSPVYT